MVTIQGIFDGNKLIPLEKLPKGKKYKVIITFLEELTQAEEIRYFTSQSDAFGFWEKTEEDIYQDFLLSNKA